MPAAVVSTRNVSMTRSRRFHACRAVTSISWTITCSAIGGSPRALFDGMRGMNRLFQGAATVDSILRGDLIEHAARAGLRSLFVGFETLLPANLERSNKRQNLGRDYGMVTRRLHDLGIMINGSFVFGMDGDDRDVFRRTVDWAIEQGITTAHLPHPDTIPGHEALRAHGREPAG